jgi:hypothetical protein
VGAGPALVFFAAPETFELACGKPAEFLYSLTWGYLWKDYLSKGYLCEGYLRSKHLAVARPGEPRILLAFLLRYRSSGGTRVSVSMLRIGVALHPPATIRRLRSWVLYKLAVIPLALSSACIGV